VCQEGPGGSSLLGEGQIASGGIRAGVSLFFEAETEET
jgi:hypothetical protein